MKKERREKKNMLNDKQQAIILTNNMAAKELVSLIQKSQELRQYEQRA